jgi:hypothetical protein
MSEDTTLLLVCIVVCFIVWGLVWVSDEVHNRDWYDDED